MPRCASASGSVRASRMPNCATCASVVQTFWPFTTYSSPSRTARVGERREVAARAGLAEQLAPDLGAVEEAGQPALLLFLGAGDEQRRAGPADPDRVQRARDLQLAHRLVELELLGRAGVEAPRRRPVRRDEARPARAGGSSPAGTRRPGACSATNARSRSAGAVRARAGHEREPISSVPPIRSELRMRSGAREPATMSDAQRRAADDGELARLVADGDRLALGELYRRHAGPCLGLARRVLADRVLAEEVVQEVFVRTVARPERFDPDRGSMRSFLLAQVHGRSVDLLRAETARRGPRGTRGASAARPSTSISSARSPSSPRAKPCGARSRPLRGRTRRDRARVLRRAHLPRGRGTARAARRNREEPDPLGAAAAARRADRRGGERMNDARCPNDPRARRAARRVRARRARRRRARAVDAYLARERARRATRSTSCARARRRSRSRPSTTRPRRPSCGTASRDAIDAERRATRAARRATATTSSRRAAAARTRGRWMALVARGRGRGRDRRARRAGRLAARPARRRARARASRRRRPRSTGPAQRRRRPARSRSMPTSGRDGRAGRAAARRHRLPQERRPRAARRRTRRTSCGRSPERADEPGRDLGRRARPRSRRRSRSTPAARCTASRHGREGAPASCSRRRPRTRAVRSPGATA